MSREIPPIHKGDPTPFVPVSEHNPATKAADSVNRVVDSGDIQKASAAHDKHAKIEPMKHEVAQGATPLNPAMVKRVNSAVSMVLVSSKL